MASGSTPPIPTLATIAAASGFSVSTVSRALQGNPALPAATVRKIRAAARAVGYRPNPLVSHSRPIAESKKWLGRRL
jgi:LacI family transcriptional regulator